MEVLSVKQKSPKHSKADKKKPLKIVYISNPVKFTTSPDQFRAVVQQFTGRHSTAAHLQGAYDEVTDFSMVKETCNALIPAKSEIEHRTGMPDRCHNGATASSSYGDLEVIFEMFGEKTASELLLSYDPNSYELYDAYTEALGLRN
jgi:VQ motif